MPTKNTTNPEETLTLDASESAPKSTSAFAEAHALHSVEPAVTDEDREKALNDPDRDDAEDIAARLSGSQQAKEAMANRILLDSTPLGEDGQPAPNADEVQREFMETLKASSERVLAVDVDGVTWRMVPFEEITGKRASMLLETASLLLSTVGITGQIGTDLLSLGITFGATPLFDDFLGIIYRPDESDSYDPKRLNKKVPDDEDNRTYARMYGEEISECLTVADRGLVLYRFFSGKGSGSKDGIGSFLSAALRMMPTT